MWLLSDAHQHFSAKSQECLVLTSEQCNNLLEKVNHTLKNTTSSFVPITTSAKFVTRKPAADQGET